MTLLNDAEWAVWSDSEIARRRAVSREFVTRMRPKDTCDPITSIERTFVHPKTGEPTKMETARIGTRYDPVPESPAVEAEASGGLVPNPPEQQADHAEFHEQAQESLPQAIRDMEAAKQQAIAARKGQQDHGGLSPEDRIAELQEAVRVLEAETQELRAENKKYEEMRVQFEQGGFEKVLAGKDEEIRVLLTRVEHESGEKVRNLRRGDHFLKILREKYGWSRDAVIDLETGDITNG